MKIRTKVRKGKTRYGDGSPQRKIKKDGIENMMDEQRE